MDNLTKNKIQKLIESNSLMVFMKGTKLMPQCGFSNNVVQILNSLGVAFNTFDVLSDFEIREGRQEGKFRQLIVKKSEHHQEKENEE